MTDNFRILKMPVTQYQDVAPTPQINVHFPVKNNTHPCTFVVDRRSYPAGDGTVEGVGGRVHVRLGVPRPGSGASGRVAHSWTARCRVVGPAVPRAGRPLRSSRVLRDPAPSGERRLWILICKSRKEIILFILWN